MNISDNKVISQKDTDPSPKLIIRKLNIKNITRFHDLYAEVMTHVKIKLETLNLLFFHNLVNEMDNDIVLLCLEDKNKIQGAALLGLNGSHLNFLLVGFDYLSRDKYHTYFNLLNGIIAYGIENGFKTIDLGQTTEFIKQRLGATSEPVYFYIRSLSKPHQLFIDKFRKFLFPKTILPHYRVFKKYFD
jgi:predicted N-acyltransferase